MQEFGSQRQIPRGLNSTTVGGHPVFRGESEPETESAGNKMLHVWALVDDDAYTFSFSARQSDYQEYLPTIEKMINSFRFLNVSSLDSFPCYLISKTIVVIISVTIIVGSSSVYRITVSFCLSFS